jgi:IS6 family transposase
VRWVYLYRAIDQFGQVIDVLVSTKRDLAAPHRFFTQALEHGPSPTEVNADRAPAYPRVLDELLPAACHVTEQYRNNREQSERSRSWPPEIPTAADARSQTTALCPGELRRARLRSNLHRGHYEVGTDVDPRHRIPHAFIELAAAV